MPSLISDYEYDIFISYRQKDNKGDRWVTEFVNALKAELEATFKEDISIYFDENNHDGLLETHNVDKSLSHKIVSVILIPILSQTYCDPKSFAWQSEFLPFVRLAEADKFGTNIRLRNGNVASRILPVRIHDIDAEDLNLLEKSLNDKPRCIDFIFRSPGVNRPLKPDDLRTDNASRAFYRDQVNKVANAVKEIIRGAEYLGTPSSVADSKQNDRALAGTDKRNGRAKKYVIAALTLLSLGLFSYYLLTVTQKGSAEVYEKSIAVLPFVDLSPDHDQEYLCDGLAEEIRNTLSRIKDLKVAGRTSSLAFKGEKVDLKNVGDRLDVGTVLEGTIQKIGNTLRISITLSNAQNGYAIWSELSNREFSQVLKVESDVANEVTSKIIRKLNVNVTPNERLGFYTRYTDNYEAYKYYLKGRQFWDQRTKISYDSAEANYRKALELDPNYALAYSGIADCYILPVRGMSQLEGIPIARTYALKALSLDSTLCEALTTIGFIESAFDYDWAKSKKTLERAIALNPNYPIALIYHGNLLQYTNEDVQQGLIEVKKALSLDPLSASINWVMGRNYFFARQYDSAYEQLKKAITIFPKYIQTVETLIQLVAIKNNYSETIELCNGLPVQWRGIALSHTYALSGDIPRAKQELNKALKEFPRQSLYILGKIYTALNDYDSALTSLEKAYDVREIDMYFVNSDPAFDALRTQPRFLSLLKKMRFTK